MTVDISSKAESSLSGQALRQSLRAADICVLTQGADMRYCAAENLPLVLQEKWREGCAEEDIFPAEFAAEMRRLKRQILAAEESGAGAGQTVPELILLLKNPGEAEETEAKEPERQKSREKAEAQPPPAQSAASAAPAGEAEPGESAEYRAVHYLNGAHLKRSGMSGAQDLWLKFTVGSLRDESGQLTGFVSTGVNISELRVREELLQALLREVSHRSKNLLAIIQSIAAQTARFSRGTAAFLKKFQGRLHSLASSQDLVTESDWRGARLRDLVYAQTHFYAEALADEQKPGCKILSRGQNPYLFPSAALHIGLALHELTINSAAFGALARGAGSIKICCEKRQAETETGRTELMRLSWCENFAAEEETGGAAPEAEAMPNMPAHFGRAVLERIVPAAVSGEANYTIKNGYIEYNIDIPADNYSRNSKNNDWIYHI